MASLMGADRGPARRVLILSQSYHRVTNGPARFVGYVMSGIDPARHGMEVRLLTEDMPGAGDRDPLVAEGRVMGVDVSAALRVRPLGPWLRMWAYYRAARQLHGHWPFDAVVFINAWTGRLMSAFWPSMPLAGMINDDNLAAPRVSGGLAGFRTRLLGSYERWAWARMPLIYTNSDYLTEALTAAYGPASGAVCRLYKSVEVGDIDFRPDRPAGRGARPQVLFVKTDWQRGGLIDLIEALALYTPGIQQARLTVIGPPEGDHERIRGLAAGALATGRLTLDLLGQRPPGDVRRLLYEADVFCVPARAEALGVANIEAALCGTPIVSTRVGGIPEVLDMPDLTHTGEAPARLVPPGDPAALGAALAACLAEPDDLRHTHAEALARHIRERFDRGAMLDRFAEALGAIFAAR